MCLAIPSKIVSIKDKKITVDELGKEKEVSGSLVETKIGDYVILQNNFIVRKINPKAAKEVLSLLKKEGRRV